MRCNFHYSLDLLNSEIMSFSNRMNWVIVNKYIIWYFLEVSSQDFEHLCNFNVIVIIVIYELWINAIWIHRLFLCRWANVFKVITKFLLFLFLVARPAIPLNCSPSMRECNKLFSFFCFELKRRLFVRSNYPASRIYVYLIIILENSIQLYFFSIMYSVQKLNQVSVL